MGVCVSKPPLTDDQKAKIFTDIRHHFVQSAQCLDKSDVAQAIAHCQQALDLQLQVDRHDMKALATVYFRLAELSAYAKDLVEAERFYNMSHQCEVNRMEKAGAGGGSMMKVLDVSAAGNNIGVAAWALGQHDRAMECFRQDLSTIDSTLSPPEKFPSLEKAIALNNVCVMYRLKGIDDNAALISRTQGDGAFFESFHDLRRRSVAIFNKWTLRCGRSWVRAITPDSAVLEMCAAMGLYLQLPGLVLPPASGAAAYSASMCRISLIARHRLAGSTLEVAAVYNNLGEICRAEFKLEEAISHFRKCLALREVLAPKSSCVAAVLNNMSSVLLMQSKLKDAAKYAQTALAIASANYAVETESLKASLSRTEDEIGRANSGIRVEGKPSPPPLLQRPPWEGSSLRGELLVASYTQMGTVYRQQGRLREAAQCFDEAHAMVMAAGDGAAMLQLGEKGNKQACIASFVNVGVLQALQGRLDEASDSFRTAVALGEEEGSSGDVQLSNNPDVAIAWCNLGEVSRLKFDFVDAEKSIKKGLAMLEALGGDRGTNVEAAASLNSLGMIHRVQGRYEEALTYFRQARQIRKAYASLILGQMKRKVLNLVSIRERAAPDSLDVASSYNSMGEVFLLLHRFDEAMEHLQMSLMIRKKHAPDSLDVAESFGNIGEIMRKDGRIDEAIDMHKKSLAIRRRLAPGSVDECASFINLGGVFQSQGMFAEALMAFERASSIALVVAPDSLILATCYSNAGDVFRLEGNLEASVVEQAKARSIREKLAPRSLDMADSLSKTGLTHMDLGQLPEAEACFRAEVEMREKIVPGTVDIASALHNLSECCCRQGKLAEATKLHQRSLALREHWNASLYDPAQTYQSMISVLHQQGDEEGAIELAQKARGLRERFSAVHCSTASAAGFRCSTANVFWCSDLEWYRSERLRSVIDWTKLRQSWP